MKKPTVILSFTKSTVKILSIFTFYFGKGFNTGTKLFYIFCAIFGLSCFMEGFCIPESVLS